MSDVVIFGDGQIVDLAHYFLTHDSDDEVVAFSVDGAYIKEDTLRGLPIVAFEDMQRLYPPEDFKMFIAIGHARMNKLRQEKYQTAKDLGYSLVTYVSSRATTWPDANIGDNCFIQENNVIQPFVKIGSNVVMWSGNHIGHETHIGDHCFLTSHCVVSGNVTIEPNCFIGVNATIRDGITIARECLIGAGAMIMKDTQPREVYVGHRATLRDTPTDKLPPGTLGGRVRPRDPVND